MSESRCRLRVRVTTRSASDAIAGRTGDLLHIRVRAAPVDGAANDAVIRLVARALGVAPSRISLAYGGSRRMKTLEVSGIEPAMVDALGVPPAISAAADAR